MPRRFRYGAPLDFFHEIKRRRNRIAYNRFEDFCVHTLGCDSCVGRNFPLRLFLRDVLSLLASPALDHAHSWLRLFGECFLEHQRHLAQLHS